MPLPERKSKILHLITGSVLGGSQDNTFSTTELHDRSRYRVHLACNPSGHWIDRARQAADVFHPIPSLVAPVHPLKDLQAFFHILILLRREKFDLVHTHTAKAGILGRLAAWLCRIPVVHTYHAFPFHDFMPAWKRALYQSFERLVRPLTDSFITVSENERQLGLKVGVLDSHNSRTVYSGINFSKLDPPTDIPKLRAQLNIPPGWHTLLMAGRLDTQKAPHLLVQAFRKVVDAYPQTLLLIAGDGQLRPLVEETSSRLGLTQHVRLLGFRTDMPDLLNTTDIFALSSLFEGMGRAMTEAMLLAKPVVVPNTNGIPEIVHNLQTGLLYQVGNTDELAAHLIYLLRNPEEKTRLGQNARRLTRQIFDIHHMVNQIESIYQQLLHAEDSQPIQTSPEPYYLSTNQRAG